MCNTPSSSIPRERIRPTFSFRRRTGFDVGLIVTFWTGSTMSLQNNVPRTPSFLSRVVTFTPASAPGGRWALRKGLFGVRTFARRKLRYNSFRVGARTARYIDPVTETLRPRARNAESLGLKARYLPDG